MPSCGSPTGRAPASPPFPRPAGAATAGRSGSTRAPGTVPGISGAGRPRPVQRPRPCRIAPGALTRRSMTETRQVLFIQGGGAGHARRLGRQARRQPAAGARRRVRGPLPADARRGRPERRDLGSGHPARRSPPSTTAPSWSAIRSAGRSSSTRSRSSAPKRALGGDRAARRPVRRRRRLAGDEFELPDDLGARLPPGVPVHLFHGLDDDTAPPAHADLYARAIPQAQRAPASRARSPAGQRPARGRERDPAPSTARSPDR